MLTKVAGHKINIQKSTAFLWASQVNSVLKNPPANAGDTGLIPGWGRSPQERNGNPLQYSCLGNPMDRGAWWVTVHGVDLTTKQDTEHSLHPVGLH